MNARHSQLESYERECGRQLRRQKRIKEKCVDKINKTKQELYETIHKVQQENGQDWMSNLEHQNDLYIEQVRDKQREQQTSKVIKNIQKIQGEKQDRGLHQHRDIKNTNVGQHKKTLQEPYSSQRSIIQTNRTQIQDTSNKVDDGQFNGKFFRHEDFGDLVGSIKKKVNDLSSLEDFKSNRVFILIIRQLS